jgi:hypothetical protein
MPIWKRYWFLDTGYWILDAGYWMLVEDPVFSGDIQECSNSEVQKHPDFGELNRVVSSI